MIGIIGAISSEVDGLKNVIEGAEVFTIAGMDFVKGKLYGKDVVVVKSGMGKVNSAMCTQILILNFNVDTIIDTGVAGAIDSSLEVLDIVIAKDCIEHDFDATALGYERAHIPMAKTSVYNADEELANKAYELAVTTLPKVKTIRGRVLTGDQFISTPEKKDDLVNAYKGECADMKGAAMAHVAYANDTKFVIIRTISDEADKGANVDYTAFEKLAAKNSIALLKELLKTL